MKNGYSYINNYSGFSLHPEKQHRKQELRFYRYVNNKDLTKKFINIKYFSQSKSIEIIKSELELINIADKLQGNFPVLRIEYLGFSFSREENYYHYFPLGKTDLSLDMIESLHKRFILNTPKRFIDFITFIKENQSYINMCML